MEAPLSLLPELTQRWGDNLIPFVEVGVGATEAFLMNRIDLSKFTAIGFEDGVLNLSRLCFGTNEQSNGHFCEVVLALADALEQDVRSGLLKRAAIPMAWGIKNTIVTLSVAGDGQSVVDTMRHLVHIIDLRQEPHEWIDAVSDWVRKSVVEERPPVLWQGIQRGVLEIQRSGVVGMKVRMPAELREHLIQSGDLKLSNNG